MNAAARHVGHDDLQQARDLWGRAGPYTLGASLARASQPPEGLHDRDGAWLPSGPALTADAGGCATALRVALPGLDDGAIQLLWQTMTARPSLRNAFDVLLQRSLTPLAGLLTYPAEQLFSESELAQLAAVRQQTPTGTPATGAVTGIVKVTRHCNLRCTYCHDWRDGTDAHMDANVRLRTMNWLIRGSRARQVHVILHGGEPTLIGQRGFLRLLALQAHLREPWQQVHLRVQTNGTHWPPGLLALLRQFDVSVSVSLDGPPEVHDTTRRDAAGRPSSARVLAALRTLADMGLLAGVVMVVTPTLVACGGRRLIEFLRAEGLGSVALLAMRPQAGQRVGPADSLPVVVYNAFLLEVQHWRTRLAPWIRVRELDAVLDTLRGQQASTCELQGRCVGRYFSIEPDGQVMHCDKYLGDERYVLGTVRDDFAAVAWGSRALELARHAAQRQATKRDCPWFHRCQGWCPHEDYVAQAQGQGRDGCCGLAPLYAGLAERTPVAVDSAPGEGQEARHAEF